jgi:drug/metabolite transporter (DMT)-like permease
MNAQIRPLTQPSLWLRAIPIIFVLIWSTGFIVARYGMPHAPPLSFLCVRYALSLLCFVLWVLAARVPWPQGHSQWLHLAAVGALMHAGYLGGVWSAVKAGMGAGLIALMVGLLFDEKVSLLTLIGTLITAVGVLLVVRAPPYG